MLDFIPRKQVVARLESGWRLIPEHDYAAGEWAILMEKPVDPEPLTAAQIKAMFEQIEPPPPAADIRRCKRGHYLAGDNIFHRKDGRGVACRECMRIGQRLRRASERLETRAMQGLRKAMGVPA